MALGKMFEKTIKLVGTVSKVGVQLGADIVGTVVEKIDDDPRVKRRISEYGSKKGQSIKTMTTEVASKSSEIVDRAVDNSINVLKVGSVIIKDAISQVAEGIDSSIKGMNSYNNQTMQNHSNKSHYDSVEKQSDKVQSDSITYKKNYNQKQSTHSNISNTLPIETYSISEIKEFSNYDFLIISKFISVSNKVVFDIIVKSNGINIGSYILINNTSGTFATRIISIGSAVNEYDILKDGTINIIKKGVPRCRELYKTGTRNEILSIVVQDTPANYRFIGRNELAKGTISTEEKCNKCINIKSKNISYQKSENKVSAENIPKKIDTMIIGLKFKNGQSPIQKLEVGDSVKLIREPNNIYDKDSIAIYNVNSEMLGYIAKDDEKELAKAMDEGIEYESIVTSKKVGSGLSYGVDIQVRKVNINAYTSKSNISYQRKNAEYGNPLNKQDKNENKSTSVDSRSEYEANTKIKRQYLETTRYYGDMRIIEFEGREIHELSLSLAEMFLRNMYEKVIEALKVIEQNKDDLIYITDNLIEISFSINNEDDAVKFDEARDYFYASEWQCRTDSVKIKDIDDLCIKINHRNRDLSDKDIIDLTTMYITFRDENVLKYNKLLDFIELQGKYKEAFKVPIKYLQTNNLAEKFDEILMQALTKTKIV
ncbi:HIRAN domain-containing protein [Clostridium sp. ZBS20]|uniref:HIRAN domain-containing protein n=1 Tax=Clostridium sp. ZBS20 TaxID=2949966 RepID=UPI00207932FE|nr:HIRAN domain-containing protein [Clostridium sp. ZBS20]